MIIYRIFSFFPSIGMTIIIDAKCSILYLPPYSPELNPIEEFWANLKRFIGQIMVNSEKLSVVMDYAFRSLSQMA